MRSLRAESGVKEEEEEAEGREVFLFAADDGDTSGSHAARTPEATTPVVASPAAVLALRKAPAPLPSSKPADTAAETAAKAGALFPAGRASAA